ncbi:unnamed protein product [Symbiodinium pilosum]|uniref:N,N-dimethylformamidase beta subunit-like C-terminal domain-containing protein n=1 Tax=Symbiodinium pilosum TaxID=2952 RepID=A0A812ILH3_SYMPI|nr:unnamed protein product [Symbiodinium pilosum]
MPQDCAEPVNEIVRENCRIGHPANEWDINAAGSSLIQGFATQSSYAVGEEVLFKVKTTSRQYRFDIYRLGWYNGLGARRVTTLEPSANLPQEQPECYKDDATFLVDCGNWAVSGTWSIPHDSVPGIYFARLVMEDPPSHWRTDASEIMPSPKFANRNWDYREMPPCGMEDCPSMAHAYGAQRHRSGQMLRNALKEPHASHVYFVVRQDARKTDILLQTIDTTWRAYNNYAAPSTYGVLPLPRHNMSMPESWQNRRAYKVSYNAPLVTRDTRAVNTLFNAELPAVRWLERRGYDIQYWTGVDAHARGGEIPKRARVYVSVGHDEYWSGEQRRHVEAARDAGVHLHFWSGNEVYWKVRWEASPVTGEPMRTMVVYKESQESFKIDPEKGQWTGTFRDSKSFNPEGANPENSLTGTIFTVNAWRHDALEIPGAYAKLRVWRHTDVASLNLTQKAVLLKGLLGHEWDEDLDNGFRPEGMIRLSETKVDNVQAIVDHGACFDSGSATHHLTLYKAKSGALVFGAGTVQWAWGLDNFHDAVTGMNNMWESEYNTRIGVDPSGPDPAVQQATLNLFADMGVHAPILGESLVRPSESTDQDPPVVSSVSLMTQDQKQPRGLLVVQGKDAAGEVAAVEWSSDRRHWHPMKRHLLESSRWVLDVPSDGGDLWFRAVDDSLNIGKEHRWKATVEL